MSDRQERYGWAKVEPKNSRYYERDASKEPENFRPISLLSNLTKLFERGG